MNPERKGPPELLLPAGEPAVLRTAVDNGADAVYLGASAFSARGHAVNFDDAALAEAVRHAHERSSRIYLAVNTLIADEELPAALDLAVRAAAIGVDAIILQDLGLARLIGQALPGLPLHASTQMTIYDESALPALAAIGFRRIILPREFILPEIAAFTQAAHAIGLETEVFIHGALCVCFSGQCLYSSLTAGRSGNRGVCAQPCRLDYRLSEDGRLLPSAACLSPKDQAAYAHMSEVAATGVDSLKIEGRMRSAAYVAQTAATYRGLLDAMPRTASAEQAAPAAPVPAPSLREIEERLLLAFNRGGSFTDRAFSGQKDRTFLSGANVGSHGILIGTIAEVRIRGGVLAIALRGGVSAPERGDVLSVRREERKDEADPAGRKTEVASAPIGTAQAVGGNVAVQGFHPDVLARLRPGDEVYRMNSARADQALLNSHARRTPVAVALAAANQDIRLTVEVCAGPFAGFSAEATVPADPDTVRPLQVERAREQLKKTGGTPYQVDSLRVEEPVALTIGGLNQLRRQVLAQLGERLAAASRREAIPDVLARLHASLRQPLQESLQESLQGSLEGTSQGAPPESLAGGQTVPPHSAAYFHRWPEHDDALACGADAYLLPATGLEQPSSRDQLAALRAAEPNAVCVLVLPPAAAGLQAGQLRAWRADGTLGLFDRIAGGHPGLAALALEAGIGFEADSTANIYNHLSLETAILAGARAACPSAELTDAQRLRLATQAGRLMQASPADADEDAGSDHDAVTGANANAEANANAGAGPAFRLDWPVHGRQRLIYSAYCPVGSNVEGCQRCHGHRYLLQDRRERQMPLLLHPPYCTATILNAEPVKPPENLSQLIRRAPARLRLMFLDERQDERKNLVKRLMSGF